MKTKQHLGIAALTLVLAVSLFAGRTPGGRLAAQNESEYSRPATHMTAACEECEHLSNGTAESTTHAMALCAEDAKLACSTCGETSKAIRTGPVSKGRPTSTFKATVGADCLAGAQVASHATHNPGGHVHH